MDYFFHHFCNSLILPLMIDSNWGRVGMRKVQEKVEVKKGERVCICVCVFGERGGL